MMQACGSDAKISALLQIRRLKQFNPTSSLQNE